METKTKRKFKVISGACPYPPQKVILDHGEEVDEDFFEEHDVAPLIKDGFIEEVKPKVKGKKPDEPIKE